MRAHSVCVSLFSPGPFQPPGVCEGCWELQQENGGRPSGPDHRRRPLPDALPAEAGELCHGAPPIEGPIRTTGFSGKNAVFRSSVAVLTLCFCWTRLVWILCSFYVHFGRVITSE